MTRKPNALHEPGANSDAKPASSPPRLRVVAPAADPAVREFQTDAIELEERRPPPLARITLYAVAAMLAAGITWASLARLDEIVVAQGKLITAEPTIVLQPLETAVLRQISVRPGDVVREGQVLARLDPTFSEADAEQLQARIKGLSAQVERIEAELAGAVYTVAADAEPVARDQARLSIQRAAFYDARLADFDTRIRQAEAGIAAAGNEQVVLDQRLAGLQEIDTMRATLAESGTGSRLSYLEARDVSLDLEASLTRIRGDHDEGLEALERARAERVAFIEEYRRLSMEQLVDIEDELARAREERRKAELRMSMAVMTAPTDAAVLEVAHLSIGSVAREAEPLISLVPLDVSLVAEVSVPGPDVGHIAEGDDVRVKLDAFPFQKHGTIDGKVLSISRDAFALDPQTGGGASIYRARVALGPIALRGLENVQLLPGMSVVAEIDVGDRTVLSYFLYPLTRGLDESLREP